HPFAVPGMITKLIIQIEDEHGFTDRAETYIKLGDDPEDHDPFGPDEYGYVCFDHSDTTWEMAPVYNWIELNEEDDDFDFDGDIEELDLDDTGDNRDEATVVELPFTFQYYGEEFNELTICTNGWAAFGDQSVLLDFRNRRIAQALGPNAHLAVWWDNLKTDADTKILTGVDEDRGVFIVEWSKIHRLINTNDSGDEETFQLLLYDIRTMPTPTADGVIVYQYKDVKNGSAQARNDTPYCTIGIGNLDDSDGLEYTYWDTFTPGALPFPNNSFGEYAIMFTTAASQFTTGVLAGHVVDHETDQPVEGAEIVTTKGFYVITDSSGFFATDQILVGEGYQLDISRQGYNPAMYNGDDGVGYAITENDTTWVDIRLLHPEFALDQKSMEFWVMPDSVFEMSLNITNDGNGPLEFDSKYIVLKREEDGDAPRRDAELNTKLLFNASDPVDNTRLQCIEYVDSMWYVGAQNPDRSGGTILYRYDWDGDLQDTLLTEIPRYRGIYDMKYVNDLLYCVADTQYLYILDPVDGSLLEQYIIPDQLYNNKSLAVTDDGRILITTIRKEIFEYSIPEDDSVLVRDATYEMPFDPRPGMQDANLIIYGLAWFRDDNEGYQLYINHYGDAVTDSRALFKLDLETQDVKFVTDFSDIAPEYENFRGKSGLCITPKWDHLIWSLAMILDNTGGDGVGVFELAPNSSWIDYEPRDATIEAGNNLNLTFYLSSTELAWADYGLNIRFTHNADSGWSIFPIDFHV
ncbi:hypothetical protein ACFLQV_05100, partial [Calditrichota bacterium]